MLAVAIRATYERCGTSIPEDMPFGMTNEFGRDRQKQAQWRAFLSKNRLSAPDLEATVAELRAFARAINHRGGDSEVQAARGMVLPVFRTGSLDRRPHKKDRPKGQK